MFKKRKRAAVPWADAHGQVDRESLLALHARALSLGPASSVLISSGNRAVLREVECGSSVTRAAALAASVCAAEVRTVRGPIVNVGCIEHEMRCRRRPHDRVGDRVNLPSNFGVALQVSPKDAADRILVGVPADTNSSHVGRTPTS